MGQFVAWIFGIGHWSSISNLDLSGINHIPSSKLTRSMVRD